KTSLLFRLKNNKEIKTTQTKGYHTETIIYQNVKLTVLDIGGAPQLRKAWSILFVVDANDHDRIEEAKTELHKLMMDEIIWGVPVIVLANKKDSEGIPEKIRMVTIFSLLFEGILKETTQQQQQQQQQHNNNNNNNKLLVTLHSLIKLTTLQKCFGAPGIEEMKRCLDIADEHPCTIIGSSSKTGEGLDEALKLLLYDAPYARKKSSVDKKRATIFEVTLDICIDFIVSDAPYASW
ncbi:hypothetical protein KUTeg_008889, partial [Tegillarca granosa]